MQFDFNYPSAVANENMSHPEICPTDKSNLILPLQLNTIDLIKPQLQFHQNTNSSQKQPPTQSHSRYSSSSSVTRRTGSSDPLLSPSFLLTPNGFEGYSLDNNSSNSNNYSYSHPQQQYSSSSQYPGQHHQHQNSISSLASSYQGVLSNGLSGGSSTAVSDFFTVNGNSSSYEPITPPDYLPNMTTNFDSFGHSRKSSMSSAIWTSQQQQAGGTGTGAGAGAGSGSGSGSAAANFKLFSWTNQNDFDGIPHPQALQPQQSSLDDKVPRQRLLSLPQTSINSFEKQFQSLSLNTSETSKVQQQSSHKSISTVSSEDPVIAPSTSSATSSTSSNSSATLNRKSLGFQAVPSSLSCTPTLVKNDSLGSSLDILNLSKDQYGCRVLQKKIDEDFANSYPLIFKSVYQNSAELMIDPFGNYLIQKLMINASDDDLNLILINVCASFGSIAKNQHGTRACQKLIDCLSTASHHSLLEDCLKDNIVGLVQDLNGNHVIQKCISKFQNEDLQFIIESICVNMTRISTHKHGCCVLQKLLNKCNNSQVLRLGEEIIRNSILLMQDQFGNYVVQYLITLNLNMLNIKLIEIMIPFIAELSSQKFSSNVVEKCLKIKLRNNFNIEIVNPLLDALLNNHILISLIKDQYGNYVIQTAMDLSNPSYKLKFANAIKPLLPLVRFTSFGKRIHNKVVSVLNEYERSEELILLPPVELTYDRISSTPNFYNNSNSGNGSTGLERSANLVEKFL